METEHVIAWKLIHFLNYESAGTKFLINLVIINSYRENLL